MAVDHTSLERIRKATFPASRRGYDKREVDKFLGRLADWLETGGGDQARSDTVRRELERVGERTGAILAEAEDSAQQIRGDAETEVAQLQAELAAETEQSRSEADAYSAEARAAADSYSQETHAAADAYSRETHAAADAYSEETAADAEQDSAEAIAAAEAKAARVVEEGVTRRRDIEAVISDLASRRDLAIGDLENLGTKLRSALADHKPAGGDPFEIPEELDPVARDGGGEEPAAGRSELDEAQFGHEELQEFDLEAVDAELDEEKTDLEIDMEAETEVDGEAEKAAPEERIRRFNSSESKS